MNVSEIDKAVEEFETARERGEYFPQAWSIASRSTTPIGSSSASSAVAAPRRSNGGSGGRSGSPRTPSSSNSASTSPCSAASSKKARFRAAMRSSIHGSFAPASRTSSAWSSRAMSRPAPPSPIVAAAIGAIHPALEIIETRGDFVGQIALALADNAQQFAFVLGPPVPAAKAGDLAKVVAHVRVNGVEVGEGRGDAVLGHPFNSVAWLATKLRKLRRDASRRRSHHDGVLHAPIPALGRRSRRDRIRGAWQGHGERSSDR